MNNATIPAVPAVQSPESTATEPMATERTAAALNRSLRWAKILWIVVALAVAVKTIATPTIHTVFPKNTAHAMCWWQGTSLYDHIPELGHFPYLPTHAILLSPFAVLGMTVGGIVWTWFNMAVLWIGLRRLIRDALPPPAQLREATYLSLAMLGAIRGIWNAQGNMLIIGLFMLSVSAMVRNRWWQAATLMTIPVYMKTWPIAMALLLVAVAIRPMAWRFAIMLAAGALLPFLTQRPSVVIWQYQTWAQYMGTISSMKGVYRDLRGVLYELKWPPSKMTVLVWQAVTGLLALVWVLWIRRRWSDIEQEQGRGQEREQRQEQRQGLVVMLTLSIGAIWCMLFGVATEYNTLVVYTPTACWILISSLQRREGRFLAVLCFALPLMLGAGALERILVKFSPLALWSIPAGLVCGFIWLARYGTRQSKLRGGEYSSDSAKT